MKKLDNLYRKCLVVAISQALAAPVDAAIIEVTNNADTTIITPGNCTLRDAVASANTDTSVGGCTSGSIGADTITFSNSVVAGGTVSLTQANDIMIGSDLTINGPINGTIEVNGMNNYRVFAILGIAGAEIILNNLTVSGGSSSGSAGGGGIVRRFESELTLRNCFVSGNVGENGGGISQTGAGSLTLINTVVSNNTAMNSGGGIYSRSRIVNLIGSTLSGNNAINGSGGGIRLVRSGLTSLK